MPRTTFLVGLIAVVTLVHAQDQPRPTFRTEANYVRVDAYPTKGGAPVADLTQDDFEILENGQPQQIEQFELVKIRGGVPENLRREPNTVAEGRQAAQNPRARVFVIFLDVNHVSLDGSRSIQKPLVDALNKLIAVDDVVAVMTPDMSASSITFARKTTTIEGFLTRYWPWGERNRITAKDPQEDQYRVCYPGHGPTSDCRDDDRGVADEMIARRRELQTMSALEDLVRYLRDVREERKAILAVSEGWHLYPENPRLARQLYCEVPTTSAPGFDPLTGRLSAKPTVTDSGTHPDSCETDRQKLAQLDDDRRFRQLIDEANRANATFYPIDPRGLPVFDQPIESVVTGRAAPGTTIIAMPSVDNAEMTSRLNSLRRLAEGTDGLAIVNSNDLAGGFARVTNDLSSYYLLGYYSSGKLDGKFHSITVRVKKPGVQVRARRGYLAPTAAEVERTARSNPAASSAPLSDRDSEALAVESALRPLGSFNKETSLRLRAAAGWNGTSESLVWLVGELGLADAWRLGAQADVTLSQEGQTLASAQVKVPPGSRHFRVLLAPKAALQPGDYSVNVRTSATSQLATTADLVPLVVQAAPAASGSLIYRRGPFTGLKDVPTADLRFRRSEQMRVEIPAAAGTASGRAALLDRNGKTMAVPLTVVFRDDPDGSRWATTQVPLVPLGPGDYLVQMMVGSVKTLTSFRIVQ